MERRTSPGETLQGATQELQHIIDRLVQDDATYQATLETLIERSPFEVSAEAPIVNIVAAAITARLGAQPGHYGTTFWTDAALLANAGIQTVVLGPAGGGLHSAEEWVDIASAIDLAHILADSAIRYCT